MGLFLGPFSGNAVGGGGHGVIDPPPPGTDPGSGQRSEVDTVNRTPLRLLRTTMNKHKPKFMKVVPPGQQRGSIAPPYTWDPQQRDDWEYKLPKPSKLGECLDHNNAPSTYHRSAHVNAIHEDLDRIRSSSARNVLRYDLFQQSNGNNLSRLGLLLK